MNIRNILTQLISVVIEEAERNSSFASALNHALDTPPRKRTQVPKALTPKPAVTSKAKQGKNKRSPPILDPIEVFRNDGEPGLQNQLSRLSLEQLRDIVAANRMDPSGLVMAWKTEAKVIQRIVELSRSRNSKGDAFHNNFDDPPSSQSDDPTIL